MNAGEQVQDWQLDLQSVSKSSWQRIATYRYLNAIITVPYAMLRHSVSSGV